jgi:hypothetical protein
MAGGARMQPLEPANRKPMEGTEPCPLAHRAKRSLGKNPVRSWSCRSRAGTLRSRGLEATLGPKSGVRP